LVQERREWGIVLPDLRMHGDSQGFPPPHTLQTAAADLAALARALGVSLDAVLGHSFGGKVALLYAASTPPGLQQVWVVDATPTAGPPSGSAWQMLQAVQAMPAEFSTREDAAAQLVRMGFTPPVAQWMTTNLERVDGRYRWRLDFVALENLLRDFFRTDVWNIVADPPAGVAAHFIKARDSAVLDTDAMSRLQLIAATRPVYVHTAQGGHWIHTDNPDAILKLLTRHLP
jgi:pimeloyl-ACP methyl ester carboxylesterase